MLGHKPAGQRGITQRIRQARSALGNFLPGHFVSGYPTRLTACATGSVTDFLSLQSEAVYAMSEEKRRPSAGSYRPRGRKHAGSSSRSSGRPVPGAVADATEAGPGARPPRGAVREERGH